MKSLITLSFLFFVSHASASIDYVASEQSRPSDQEISRNRSCFDELSRQGCGDPGENIREFRSCLHDVFPTLTSGCQKMMTELYKRR